MSKLSRDFCSRCEDYCSSCADFCEDCGACDFCVDLCVNCGDYCPDCKEVCPNCEYCGDCADVCELCESIAATVKIGPVNSVIYQKVVSIMPIVIYAECAKVIPAFSLS